MNSSFSQTNSPSTSVIPPGLFPHPFHYTYPGPLSPEDLQILSNLTLNGLGLTGQPGKVYVGPVTLENCVERGLISRGCVYFAEAEHSEFSQRHIGILTKEGMLIKCSSQWPRYKLGPPNCSLPSKRSWRRLRMVLPSWSFGKCPMFWRVLNPFT